MERLILLALLVCPIVMGTMMFLMWRAMRGHGDGQATHEEAAPAKPPTRDAGEEAGR